MAYKGGLNHVPRAPRDGSHEQPSYRPDGLHGAERFGAQSPPQALAVSGIRIEVPAPARQPQVLKISKSLQISSQKLARLGQNR